MVRVVVLLVYDRLNFESESRSLAQPDHYFSPRRLSIRDYKRRGEK